MDLWKGRGKVKVVKLLLNRQACLYVMFVDRYPIPFRFTDAILQLGEDRERPASSSVDAIESRGYRFLCTIRHPTIQRVESFNKLHSCTD